MKSAVQISPMEFSEVGSMFGQIGATGRKVRGHFGQKCPNFENFIRLLKPASRSERIAIRVFIKYDWFTMINHDDQCTNKQMLGAQHLFICTLIPFYPDLALGSKGIVRGSFTQGCRKG